MPKVKTSSGAKKRFKVTGAGKLLRRHAMKSHNLEKKSSKRRRGFRKDYEVAPSDRSSVKKLLGVAVMRVLEAPVALGLLEDLAPLLAGVDGSLDARHLLHPQELLDRAAVARSDLVVLAEASPTLRRLLLEVVALHRVAAQELPRSGHLEPLLRSA